MRLRHRITTHPGIILLKKFLRPLRISQTRLSRHMGVPRERVLAIVRGEQDVDAATAWKLSWSFRTTPEFWMELQRDHDLSKTRPTRRLVRVLRAR